MGAFHDWMDYNGGAISIQLLHWGHNLRDVGSKKILLSIASVECVKREKERGNSSARSADVFAN